MGILPQWHTLLPRTKQDEDICMDFRSDDLQFTIFLMVDMIHNPCDVREKRVLVELDRLSRRDPKRGSDAGQLNIAR